MKHEAVSKIPGVKAACAQEAIAEGLDDWGHGIRQEQQRSDARDRRKWIYDWRGVHEQLHAEGHQSNEDRGSGLSAPR